MQKIFIKSLFIACCILIFPVLLFAQQKQLKTNNQPKKAATQASVPVSNAIVCATTGADGTTNINGSINTYFPPVGDINLVAGSSHIALAGVPAADTHGNTFGSTPIKTGDLLLIIQIQDAAINYNNSALYGAGNANSGPDGLGATGFIDAGNSGKFEYVVATNNVPLTGGVLNFKGSGTGGGTVYTYTNAAATANHGKRVFQVIRVPQYSNLRLTSNISPPPFNGVAGGIIAFEVAGNMEFNGFTIDVSARGFRGGYSLVKPSIGNISDLYVDNANSARVSGKGEGIAGTPRYMWDGFNEINNSVEGLPGGSGGRGAPANAGGGGNDSNAGGGGGANGNDGGVGGLGYDPIGGIQPSSGRPGSKSFMGAIPDFTSLVMGGGGGGGHANDALTGVKGGVGGGIIIIRSRTISGSGTILANGAAGAPGAFGPNPDGSGGGGAGGTVFLKVSNASVTANITIRARGGNGGNTEGDGPSRGISPHGPGGGGSGGIIFYNLPSGTVQTNVAGGQSGRTDSGNGITHGAADGGIGYVSTLNVAALPPYLEDGNTICFPLLTTTMSIVDKATPKSAGGKATYLINVSNDPSAGTATGVLAAVNLPSGFSYQSATAAYLGTATGSTTLSNTGSAQKPQVGSFIIPAGGSVTITLVVNIDCIAPATYNSNAQAVYLDPTRDFSQPDRLITPKTNAFAGSNTSYQTISFGNVTGSNYNGNAATAEDAVVNNSAVSNNAIAQTPVNQSFCTIGDPSLITGSTPVVNGTYTYQWQSSADDVNFSDINGATLKDYDPPVINATTYYRRVVTSSVCPAAFTSNVITVNIFPIISNNIITAPAVSAFCMSGNPAIITGNTPSGGDGTYTFQWQSSTDNINFTDIAGATGKNYDPGVINVVTYFRRMVVSGICNTPLASNVVKIDLQPALANNLLTAPLKTVFCSPGDASAIIGSVPTGGSGTYNYQWQYSTDNISFIDLAGATLKDYDPVALSATMYYRRLVTSGACTVPLVSASVAISIEPKLDNNKITPPAVIVFCSATDPGQIIGSTPTGGNGTYAYQWQSSADNVNYTDIAGATGRNYSPPIVNVSTYFRRIITSDLCTIPLESNVVLIQIQGNNNVSNDVITAPDCTSSNPTIITGSTPSGGTGSFTYQWQSSVNNVNFTDIAGATGINYDPGAITADTWYRRVVSSGACIAASTSNVISLKIQQAIAGNIINGPAVSTFCINGDPAQITGSTPTGGDGTYTYQWQKSTDNINFTNIAGATAKDYDPATISVTTYYRRLVTSGACTLPLTSNVVTITIQQATANNTITAPAVTSFCSNGDPGSIDGSAPTGGSGAYSYQWQSSTDNVNFVNIPGATLKNYDPAVISADTYYRRVVTSGGCITPVLSNVVGIKILNTPAAPTFVNAAPAVCPGNSTTINISSPQSGLTYNWYSSAAKTNLLFSGTAFPTGVLNTATTYYVEAKNNTCNSSLATVQVSIAPAPNVPVLVNNPVSVCTGLAAVLEVRNPQNGFTYNWYAGVTDVTPLHTGINFTTPAVNAAIRYYAEAVNTGGCSSATRTAVDVTPLALPTVTPVAKAICPGSKATLTATSNDPNAVISWYASATAPTALQMGNSFTTPNLSSTTAYYVQAVSAANCGIPTRVKVEVNMLKQLDAPVVSVDATTNTTITFKWDAITGAEGYQVSVDNGQTFTRPSAGADGLSHTISNLQLGDKITILVQALGASDCQLSGSSTAVTGTARSPLGSQIYVANTFTPNGDGNNDIVYVHGEGIKSVAFYVYDQWGELIFVSTDINKGWDGYYKGTREPVGVYVYYVKAVVNDGTQLTKKGTITLLR